MYSKLFFKEIINKFNNILRFYHLVVQYIREDSRHVYFKYLDN